MGKKIFGFIALGATIAAGTFAGYKVATDDELRQKLLRGAQDVFETSKKAVTEMSEDVALKTAKMTKNPKINQDWVENQWESIGY